MNFTEERLVECMKTITVIYDVYVVEKEKKYIAETCMDITLLDKIADNLIQTGKSGLAKMEIERAILYLERLKGRTYIKDSIKDFREDER